MILMQKRGQSATEYLMVAAIGLVIIIPMVYIFYAESYKSAERIMEAKIGEIGNEIVIKSKSIYYLGPPSKTTLMHTMPDGIERLEIKRDLGAEIYELIFHLQRGGEIVFSSDVNINADFTRLSASQGMKRIKLEALRGPPPHVNISIT